MADFLTVFNADSCCCAAARMSLASWAAKRALTGIGLIAGFHEEGVTKTQNDLPRRIPEGSRLKKGRFGACAESRFFDGKAVIVLGGVERVVFAFGSPEFRNRKQGGRGGESKIYGKH